MTWPNTLFVMVAALLAIFWQSAFTGLRQLLGVQPDLLPGLMVYAGLSCGFGTVLLLSVGGGLLFDSLSANPLGVTILPLLAIGIVLFSARELILRTQVFAQAFLGLGASGAAPLGALLLLLTMGESPLLGWGSLWQWLLLMASGAVITPLWFVTFDWLQTTFTHAPTRMAAFRPDRQIRRGRY